MPDFDAGLARSLRRVDNDTYRMAVDIEDATGITLTGTNPASALEDAASASGDTGSVTLAIQESTPADKAGTNGDYAVLQMSAGRLWTASKSTLDAETTKVIGTVNVAAAQTIAATNAGTFAVQATLAAGAAAIGKAEDVASADADVGVPAMAIQKAIPANTAGLDGDYEMLQMSAGRLWTASKATLDAETTKVIGTVNVAAGQTIGLAAGTAEIGKLAAGVAVIGALTANQSVNTAQINGVAPTMGSGVTGTGVQRVTIATDTNAQVLGSVAHDGVDSGNPVKIGGKGSAAAPTAVTEGNRVNASFTLAGSARVLDDNSAAIKTAVELIDNAVSGAGFNITQIGGAAAPIGAGVEATAVRVTLPTDGTGVVKLGAGTAEIGKLAAGTAIIGQVGIDQTTPGTTNKVVASVASGGIASGAVASGAFASGSVASGAMASGSYAANAFALGVYATPTAVQTTAYAASLVGKAAAGTLYQVFGYNSHSATVFIQVHNTASLPADTAVPIITFAVPATSNFDLDLGLMGRAFATGITFASSSTGPTLTVSGATAWINGLVA